MLAASLNAFFCASPIYGSAEDFTYLLDFTPCKGVTPAAKQQIGTFFVRSGLVHAICEGVIIAEIQQNSDTTYRVYDYNRGREIHVEKALDCIDFSLKGEKAKGLKVSYDQYDKTYLSLCEYFSLEKYDIHGVCEEESDKERFFIFTCVEGEGIITSEEGELAIKKIGRASCRERV